MTIQSARQSSGTTAERRTGSNSCREHEKRFKTVFTWLPLPWLAGQGHTQGVLILPWHDKGMRRPNSMAGIPITLHTSASAIATPEPNAASGAA